MGMPDRKKFHTFAKGCLWGLVLTALLSGFLPNLGFGLQVLHTVFAVVLLVDTRMQTLCKSRKYCILLTAFCMVACAMAVLMLWIDSRMIWLLRMWLVCLYSLFAKIAGGKKISPGSCFLSLGTVGIWTLKEWTNHNLVVGAAMILQIVFLLKYLDPILYEIAMAHRKKMQQAGMAILGVIAAGMLFVCLDGGLQVQAAEKYYVSESSGSDSNSGATKAKAFKTIQKAVEKAAKGDNIYVMDVQHIKGDVSIKKDITIGRATDATGYLFMVESGGKLTIGGNTIITGRKSAVTATRSLVLVKANASLTVQGNAVLQNNATEDYEGLGGAITNRGEFYLKGNGALKGNETHKAGGGALLNVGIFYMEGGTISGNVAGDDKTYKGEKLRSGGAISNQGEVWMTGGTIQNNETWDTGGGIYGAEGSYLSMKGGNIQKNTARSRGGGAEMQGGRFELYKGSVTSNKAAESGGIHITTELEKKKKGLFYMYGGEVSNNQSLGDTAQSLQGLTGGICVNQGAEAYFAGGVIKGNTAKLSGGGLCVGTDAKVVMTDGMEIAQNTAQSLGGGIFVRESGSLEIQSGFLHDNEAEKGGGVAVKGTLKMKDIRLKSNTAKTGKGVFHNGTCTLQGIYTDESGQEIYLATGKYLTVISGSGKGNRTIEIVPSDYTLGRVCLRGDVAGSKYMGNYVLRKKESYVFRSGDQLSQESSIKNNDVVVSRTYQIQYHKNNATEVTNFPETEYGYWKESYRITQKVPEWKVEMPFSEWNTKADATGTTYQPGGQIAKVTANVILYAIWKNEPPTLTAEDTYAVEDEVQERVTVAFLKAAAKAKDKEDGDLSSAIQVKNWDAIKTKLQESYTKAEQQALCRQLKVTYQVTDSGGKSAETTTTLTIFLIEQVTYEAPYQIRFLKEAYVDEIPADTFWGQPEQKEYLKNMYRKERTEESWEPLNLE